MKNLKLKPVFLGCQKGLTFLEVIVSLGLFAVSFIAVIEIFVLVLDGQRNAIASNNLQDNIRYAFEAMSKDLRMAHIDSGDCINVDDVKVYDVNMAQDELYFKNYHHECIHYYLDDNRIKVDKDANGESNSGYLTPDEIKISNLKFIVDDNYHTRQSIVTMKMDIETVGGKDKNRQEMKIQTTISSRYY